MRRRTAVGVARWLWEWSKSIAIAIVLFLVVRTFLVEAFRIPTRSMENTLLAGDFLLVNKLLYGAPVPGTDARLPALGHPGRGDVIVFTPPHDPARNYVKRIVGEGGDTVSMVDKVLHLNGQPIQERYARHDDPGPLGDYGTPSMLWQRAFLVDGLNPRRYHPTRDNWGPLVVPQGHFFVLGDNRDDSEDSRYWGFVREESVTGRPLVVYFSFETSSIESLPFLTDIRWSRIGGLVH